jgi:diacylglycerol kinase family enzyme
VTDAALAERRLTEIAALERPPRAKRMLVIVNPYATTMTVRLRNLVVYALQGRYDVVAIETERRGHATELCVAAAEEKFDVVAAFGGDGTVNEVANALAGTGTPLTVIPGGSNNVFAKMLGIPNDVVDATEHLLGLADAWRERRVDLGRLDDRRFVFSAGMGLDASVVERVDSNPRLKARFGPWYFAHSAVRTFLARYVVRPPRLDVTVGGKTLRGVSAFVQNGEAYTYFQSHPIEVASGAALDSGDLSGAVLTRASPVDVPTVAFRALSKRAEIGRHRQVEPFSGVQEVVVRSVDGRPLPVHVDGDHIGDQVEARFIIEPQALRIVC